MADAASSGYAGQQQPTDDTSEFNKMVFLVRQILAAVRVGTEVIVRGVVNDGGLSPVGFVDVQPLVNMIDGDGNATEHGTVYGIPYFRLQGGTNAVIIDPAINDIGILVVADRDISAVKATRGVSNPGSRRQFSLADGMYIGGNLNGTPTQYVRFFPGGIEITDANENTILMDAAGVTINGVLIDRSGNVKSPADITARFGLPGQIGVASHTHTQGNDSHGDTEAPVSAPTAGT